MHKKILIATGGTGGHVFPSIALMEFLEKESYKVIFTTDKRGKKYFNQIKKNTIYTLPMVSFNKKNLFSFLIFPVKLIFSIFYSIIIMTKHKPITVFGMGGYASFPSCLVAKILGIKLIIYENNIVAGKTNKFLSKLSNKVLTSFKEVVGFKNINNMIFVGNLIRYNFDEKKQIQTNKNKKLIILVIGGSQAAKIFGEIIPEILVKCKIDGVELEINQQCLSSQMSNIQNYYKKNGVSNNLFDFIENIKHYIEKVDIVITRAGSSMLAELKNCLKPFISIPLPSSADNHQYYNAKYYSENKMGILIEEKDLKTKLEKAIKLINKDRNIIDEIIKNQYLNKDKKVFENIKQALEN